MATESRRVNSTLLQHVVDFFLSPTRTRAKLQIRITPERNHITVEGIKRQMTHTNSLGVVVEVREPCGASSLDNLPFDGLRVFGNVYGRVEKLRIMRPQE